MGWADQIGAVRSTLADARVSAVSGAVRNGRNPTVSEGVSVGAHDDSVV